jgi:hypothetical protein
MQARYGPISQETADRILGITLQLSISPTAITAVAEQVSRLKARPNSFGVVSQPVIVIVL